MPTFELIITGFDELQERFDRLARETPQLNQKALQQSADLVANEMRKNVHVISGNLKSSIGVESVTTEDATIGVRAEYAIFENRRVGIKAGAGPHNFIDIALNVGRNKIPQIFKDQYKNI